MEAFQQLIISKVCQTHSQPYCYINICQENPHQSRMLCESCVTSDDQIKMLNIKQTFQFLEMQHSQCTEAIISCKARLWMDFQNTQSIIMELLRHLEKQMEIFINSILEHELFRILKTNYFESEVTSDKIESFGQFISGHIDKNQNEEYYIKQETPFSQHLGYIQSNQLLNAQKKVRNILQTYLDSLSNRVLKKQNYEKIQTLSFDQECYYVNFNHEETQIVAAVGKSLQIFSQYTTGKWVNSEELRIEHSDIICQAKFNHDSTQIASCSFDKLIIIWSKKPNGKWDIHQKICRHCKTVYSISFNHNSTLLVSGSADRTIQVHYQQQGKWNWLQQLDTHINAVYDACFNHDSTLLASTSGGQDIILWNRKTDGQWVVKQKLQHQSQIRNLSFSYDSNYLVSSSYDKLINIWQVNKGVWESIHTLIGHTQTISKVQFNKESNMIVSCGYDKFINIWRVDRLGKWKCTQTIKEHNDSVYCVIVKKDSSIIISTSQDNTIIIHKLMISQQFELQSNI